MSKVRSIASATDIRGARAFLAELEDAGYEAVIVCGVRRNEDGSTSLHPSVYGPFKPADVVLACERMKWIELAEIDELSRGDDE